MITTLDIPSEEKLRMQIHVIAPAIVWIGVIGNINLGLRHPQNTGPSRKMVENFARELIGKLLTEKVFTEEQARRALRDLRGE